MCVSISEASWPVQRPLTLHCAQPVGAPILIALVTFVCHTKVFHQPLDATTAFTALALFNVLRGPCWFPRVSRAKAVCQRKLTLFPRGCGRSQWTRFQRCSPLFYLRSCRALALTRCWRRRRPPSTRLWRRLAPQETQRSASSTLHLPGTMPRKLSKMLASSSSATSTSGSHWTV